MKARLCSLIALCAALLTMIDGSAQNKQPPPKKDVIPHAQSQPPGPPLSPQEALKKMKVPPGFHVELVAAEPDIVNPVAMTFDERGRIWITESIEYPRRAAGPGKDRVKLLESTKGDGKFDKITTVIEGLNIPSGIAIGHGGVWLANAPDLLFYPFKDFATAKLGKPQVVVTGFGRSDTHELPNSLTWGPDGWLYGLNGVFNPSHIKHQGKEFKFTCALFRIHPKTKEFGLFCEGTSNPWGLAFNDNGDAFVSACVIDHLWHLTETGYYHRQGGAYPPFTWKIGSIVKHKHQRAAYCGLCWFDSDAYPPEYREKLYMGNIHGNCINTDELTRDGSTYSAKPCPDFLSANDAWFMPVSQKVGPDGCMYILDWYDRYHCYQDANRDPGGIDRLQGRLYRVVYKDYKPAEKFDLKKETNFELVKRLYSPNIYFRETAQRLLTEWHLTGFPNTRQILELLPAEHEIQDLAINEVFPWPRKTRLHALWIRIGRGDLSSDLQLKLFQHKDPNIRAWGVRSLTNNSTGSRSIQGGISIESLANNLHLLFAKPDSNIRKMDPAVREKFITLSKDPSPDVMLQVAIAATKLKDVDPLPVLLDVLVHCGDDKLIPHIVWQNLHPLLEKDGERFLALVAKVDLAKAPGVAKVLPRAIDRILGNPGGDASAIAGFIDNRVAKDRDDPTAHLCLAGLTAKIQSGELSGLPLDKLKSALASVLPKCNGLERSLLAATLGDSAHIERAKDIFEEDLNESRRLLALDALITGRPAALKQSLPVALRSTQPPTFRAQVLIRLGKLSDAWVAQSVLTSYPNFNDDEKAKSVELLTQRPAWGKLLFKEIADKKLGKSVVNINQARRLLAMKDAELVKLVGQHWGVPRDGRNPEREKVAAQMKALFTKSPGDPKAGAPVFKKLCAQCHKIYGEGVDVGPDITANGRADFDQLLSNIFDPSLVIGAGYQAVTVNTKAGLVISGLLVEDNPQRITLKVQGGEIKTIARKDVDEQFTSKVSLMPEDLEKQLRPQEIVDLLSYLSLDRPPDDPKARKIPGTPR